MNTPVDLQNPHIKTRAAELLRLLQNEFGFSVALFSPNQPPNRQWYHVTPEVMNTKEWRIDAERGPLELTVFPDERCSLSWHLDLSDIAEEYDIELCDEYHISINFWGHKEEIRLFPLKQLPEILPRKSREWRLRASKFLRSALKACKEG